MKIVLVCASKIPVSAYVDKARIVWWLGKELSKLGHDVSLMMTTSGPCEFANILVYDEKKPLAAQIPPDTDLVHFHDEPPEAIEVPHLFTQHENSSVARTFHPNTVFLSDSHAQMHGGSMFVYPGLDFSEYAAPEMDSKRLWFHFLGNTSQRKRNVRGAIDLAAKVDSRLHVIGGARVNFRQGFSISLSPHARFHGDLSPGGRDAILNASKGHVLPMLWHKPFSLGVLESLYFGCPIFGTPFGALPEMLGKKCVTKNAEATMNGTVDAFFSDYGCLSIKKTELIEAMKNSGDFDRIRCHEYVQDKFSAQRMAYQYLQLYDKVLQNKPLHQHAPVMKDPVDDKLLSITA